MTPAHFEVAKLGLILVGIVGIAKMVIRSKENVNIKKIILEDKRKEAMKNRDSDY